MVVLVDGWMMDGGWDDAGMRRLLGGEGGGGVHRWIDG